MSVVVKKITVKLVNVLLLYTDVIQVTGMISYNLTLHHVLIYHASLFITIFSVYKCSDLLRDNK